MREISKAAIDLIVKEEISSKAYYDRRYQHFDWPGGASGPTVGIGYDCGYCVPKEIVEDWAGILSEDQIATLVDASGIKGAKAEPWVRAHKKSVTISYELARRQFDEREMPKWIDRVEAALPNTDKLSADSMGALVSLAYNRGASFSVSGVRYAEMRAIKQHMASEQFHLIPGCIREMKRLWSPSSGLCKRRDREADLFAAGLEAPVVVPLHEASERPTHDRPDSILPGPAVSIPVEASKSGSVWALVLSMLAWLGSKVQGAIDWLGDGVTGAVGLITDVKTDVDGSIGPVKALASMIGLHMGEILAAVGVGLTCVAIARHVRDKIALRHAQKLLEAEAR
jgi:hypothetical protein